MSLTTRQLAACEAVQILTLRLERAPSSNEVAFQLGVTRAAARRLMIEAERKGYMVTPTLTVKGHWGLTGKGRRALEVGK